MHVIILGAGVVGVCSAYYLNRAGHEVTIIDRAHDVAQETSFANAGQLSFGYTTPWASPSTPRKALKWLGKAHSPLIIRPDGSLFQLRWLARMLTNCTHVAYAKNQARMMRISEYSRAMFAEFEAAEKLDFEQRHRGTLHLFRQADAFRQHQQYMGVLDDFHVPYRMLNAEEILAYEPALAHIQSQIAGGFHLPNDSTGDCQLFTRQLADLLRARGVKFIFGQEINRFNLSGNRISSVQAGNQSWYADAFLCALGCFSRPMLQHIGVKLPVYPVKGYSITLDIENSDRAPQSTVLDETYKVAITRFAQRIRVGGMAELSGYPLTLAPEHRETLSIVVNELFPHSADTAKASYWSGLRPVTPDSVPIIGRTRIDNLFTNTGHGTLGWTMSLGSGRIVADLMTHGRAEVASDDLSAARYGAGF